MVEVVMIFVGLDLGRQQPRTLLQGSQVETGRLVVRGSGWPTSKQPSKAASA